MRATISGTATWTLKFDDAATAKGAKDCEYTRSYVGVENESMPWLCPTCEKVFVAQVTMTSGLADCFKTIADYDPLPEEWIGYGQGKWWRGLTYAPLSEQGNVSLTSSAVSYTHQFESDATTFGAGKYTTDISGSFSLGEEHGDPDHGFTASATYSCGWPKANPPAYKASAIKPGETIPDGVFLDACGDMARLHDFKGKYLLIETSALDCPACAKMAGEEDAAVADLKSKGIDLTVITLMTPGLAKEGVCTQDQLKFWKDKFDLHDPILADRGWGVFMLFPFVGDPEEGTFPVPSWVVVDPDLKAIEVGDSADWAAVKKIVVDHHSK